MDRARALTHAPRMTDSAKAFVESSTKAAVTAKVAEADRLENQLARERRSRKELAIATAAMGAEVAGSLLGGGVTGYMQANDWEEWIALGAVGLGAIAGMKRLDEPTNPYWQVAFATANGMGAALTAGYSRDYFSGNGTPKPMT